MAKVLIIDNNYSDDAVERRVLQPLDAELVDARIRGTRLPDEWLQRLPKFDAVISGKTIFASRELSQLNRCRVLVRRGVGFDTIDIPAATALRLPVANVPDYGTDEVATHAMALLLLAARRLDVYMAGVREGDWSSHRPGDLHRLVGQTLGIVGYGRIGRAVARRAGGFGLRVVACDPYAPDDGSVPFLTLPELLAVADYITLHTPLSAETRRMIDAAAFATMKRGAVLVNTARGPLVDPDALLQALRSGQLAAAACDVHDIEPLATDHPLLGEPNFLPTPHSAYYTVESAIDMRRLAA
ncbi:MAG TPA: C-terminal binding protein, partial [Bacillota bacterium]|nr:C-terminal binding protein [Bacillota bacterium]